MPLLSSFLISKGLWTWAFLVLGLSAFMLMIGWKRLKFGHLDGLLADQEGGQNQKVQHRSSYREKSLLFISLAAVYFFFYGGSEVSIVNFMPAIFAENWEISNSLATISVTIYWSGMVIGRALTGIVSEKLTYHRFLRLINIGSLAALAALAVSGSVWAGFALCFLIGLFMAGMFAIALIITNHFFPGKTEQTTSILLASNGLGGAMLPIAMGGSLDRFPIQTAFWLLTVLGVIMLFLVLVLQILESTKSRILKKSENSGVKSI